jgi:putative membrane protein
MTLLASILAVIVAILAVIFASQNTTVVTISFYRYSLEGSLASIILLSVGLGLVIGVLILAPGAIKRGLELRSHRRKVEGLEKTLEEQDDKIAKAEHILTMYNPPSEGSDNK